MLVLFIRIDSERIWENWGIGNVLGGVMRLDAYYLYRTLKECGHGNSWLSCNISSILDSHD